MPPVSGFRRAFLRRAAPGRGAASESRLRRTMKMHSSVTSPIVKRMAMKKNHISARQNFFQGDFAQARARR